MRTATEFNNFGRDYLPGRFGIHIETADASSPGCVTATLVVTKALMAPNDCLHGGAYMVLADTAAGYGCMNSLPEGADGFLTVEMKSNHLGTARDGRVCCVARPVHRGRTTQVWDATITHVDSGRTLVLFRCTQLLLYPRAVQAR